MNPVMFQWIVWRQWQIRLRPTFSLRLQFWPWLRSFHSPTPRGGQHPAFHAVAKYSWRLLRTLYDHKMIYTSFGKMKHAGKVPLQMYPSNQMSPSLGYRFQSFVSKCRRSLHTTFRCSVSVLATPRDRRHCQSIWCHNSRCLRSARLVGCLFLGERREDSAQYHLRMNLLPTSCLWIFQRLCSRCLYEDPKWLFWTRSNVLKDWVRW